MSQPDYFAEAERAGEYRAALATLREAVREWLAAKAAHTKAILDYFHHADGASVVVIRDKLAVEESFAARLRELATPEPHG